MPSGVPLSGERLFDALFTGVSTQLGLGSVEKCVEKRKSVHANRVKERACQTFYMLVCVTVCVQHT